MMRFWSLCALLIVLLSVGVRQTWATDAADSFQSQVLPILMANCAECHRGAKPAAGLDLTASPDGDSLRAQAPVWFQVLERVESDSMPPEDAKPLAKAEKQVLLRWLRHDYTRLLVERQRVEGRSRLRRLSRQEYANTVQDIFGIRPPVARLMPGDGRVDGYDKVSAALPFSAPATEGQLAIAEEIVERMFQYPQDQITFRMWSSDTGQSQGHALDLGDDWWVSFNSDTTSGRLNKENAEGKRNGFPGPRKPGWHRLRMNVYGYQTDKPLPVGIYVGHVYAYPQILKLLKVVDVPPGKPAIVEADVYLRTGRDSDGPSDDGIRLIPLGLGVPVPKNSLARERGKDKPGLAIQWVEAQELDATLPGQELLFADLTEPLHNAFRYRKTLASSNVPRDELEATMSKTFSRLGARLFRRDLTVEELNSILANYMTAIDAGALLKDAFVTEVSALLTSPDFLCVVEQPGRLTDFSLASRLAYFLWNSTPDAELLELARRGELSQSGVLREQTERLLRDPKSERFVEDFLDQWLGLWGIDNTTPDKDLYPEYDDELKISSLMETRATFRRMIDENLSVKDFVAPDWALLNSRLAEHYGLPAIEGFRLRQVALPVGTPFGGLWTQAAPMKVTANGTLTSPVKRGVWVSDRLLGLPIPPPPSNIEPVDPDTRGAQTLREQLALHSQQGSCKACHARFDPYGFALESFDVMGGFRSRYRVANTNQTPSTSKWSEGNTVDCSGVTPQGQAFAGVQELRRLLAERPDQLARGVTRHLLTYATGEPTTPIDEPTIEAIVQASAKEKHGLRALVHGVVQSELFRFK